MKSTVDVNLLDDDPNVGDLEEVLTTAWTEFTSCPLSSLGN